MKMKMPVVTLLLLFAVYSVQAMTGNQALAMCEASDSFEQGRCLGWIDGYTDGEAEAAANQVLVHIWNFTRVPPYGEKDTYNPTGRPPYCLPKGATLGQLQRVFVQCLKQDPKTNHGSASELARRCYIAAFPCQR